MTTAYHVRWSAPAHSKIGQTQLAQHSRRGFPLDELTTIVHGVKSWQAFHGGEIELVTDRLGVELMERIGLIELYDRVHTWLDEIDTTVIDPSIYFSAGKFELFRRAQEPFVVMDTDFYLRSDIVPPNEQEFVFTHWERTTSPDIYPDPHELPMAAGYILPDLNYEGPASNMSLAWFGDPAHARALGESAFAFAENNGADAPGHRIQRAAFAEQRLVVALARDLGIEARPFSPRIWDTATGLWEGPTEADRYHHTWFQKSWFITFPELRASYCHYLIRDLCQRQPEGAEWLAEHLPSSPVRDSLHALLDGMPIPHEIITDWRLLEGAV